jgi:hypothetical protein
MKGFTDEHIDDLDRKQAAARERGVWHFSRKMSFDGIRSRSPVKLDFGSPLISLVARDW